MAVKRELSIRRQPNEAKETAGAPDPVPPTGTSENIDKLVSSFLAELSDLSSEMKNQAGTVQMAEAPAGTPGTKPGPGEVKIPKSFQLHEDFSPDPDSEIINDQIEQSLAELESLKSGVPREEEKTPVPNPSPEPPTAPAAAKAALAPPKQALPIAPAAQDPEEQAWDRYEIFRGQFSSTARRQRRTTLITVAVAVLITILALLAYSLLTSYESIPATDANSSVPVSSANTPESNTAGFIDDAKSAPQPAIAAPPPAPAVVNKNRPLPKQPVPQSDSADRKAPSAFTAGTFRPTQAANNGVRPENQERSATQPQQAVATPPSSQPSTMNPQLAPSPEPKPAAAVSAASSPAVPVTNAPANGSAGEVASAVPKPEAPANTAAPELTAQPRRRTPVLAEIMTRVQPEYPAIARQQRVTGRVEVEADVNEKGDVVRAKAVSGPMLLRGAAEQAVTKWKFKPASIEGVDIPSKARIAVNFNLQ